MHANKDELISSIEESIEKLSKEHSLSFDQVLSILKKRDTDQKAKTIPVSIFNNDSLSCLEAIVKYLKEDLNLSYKEIAFLLNRNYDPIAITYRNAKKKLSARLDIKGSKKIPLKIFSHLKLSVLENLVKYLKDELRLTYHEIAVMLNRNDRTIWTVYNRALKK